MKKQVSKNHKEQHQQEEFSWRRAFFRKVLNLSTTNSDYSADSDSGSDSDQDVCDGPKESRNDKPDVDANEVLPRIRRRKSETFRAQYINSKEIKVCAATWNVGGKVPPDDLDIDCWLGIDDPADIYVIGLQEMIPLNAGNIFGAEDNRPVSNWETLIRETLNRVRPATKFKSYSDPHSPSLFKPSEDALHIVDDAVLDSDSDMDEFVYPIDEEPVYYETRDGIIEGANIVSSDASSPVELNRVYCLRKDESKENVEASTEQYVNKLTRELSRTERIGLCWPEPPLHLLGLHVIDKPKSLGASKSFKTSKSYSSFKSITVDDNRMKSDLTSLVERDLEFLINRRRRPAYVRIVSKQMVGVFITVWVRRSLRKHIQNLNVATVGVGVMGYIGNKGSVSVSMSIHQTFFCFICTHLTSGEKDTDAAKRNVDVHEIHKRTRFNFCSIPGLPTRIFDHERIIWMGDLNYRINLSYEQTRELISRRDWSQLLERDQLMKELKKGRAFDGWSEGVLNFPPTYKYESNSDTYFGDDPKAGRRTPSWCDRILSYGTGMRLQSYRRSEVKLSDHRPVTASYMVEVEVYCPKKLQRALTFTKAEIEQQNIVMNMGLSKGITLLRPGEVSVDASKISIKAYL